MRNQQRSKKGGNNPFFDPTEQEQKVKPSKSPFSHPKSQKNDNINTQSQQKKSRNDNVYNKQQEPHTQMNEREFEEIFQKQYFDEVMQTKNSKTYQQQQQPSIISISTHQEKTKQVQIVEAPQVQKQNIINSHSPLQQFINTQSYQAPKGNGGQVIQSSQQQNIQKNSDYIVDQEQYVQKQPQKPLSKYLTMMNQHKEDFISHQKIEEVKVETYLSPPKQAQFIDFKAKLTPSPPFIKGDVILATASGMKSEISTSANTSTKKSPTRISNIINESMLVQTSKRSDNLDYSLGNTNVSAFNTKQRDNSPSELNQEVINRLFLNNRKTQELQDKKRYVSYQREMNGTTDKPTISEKSREIALNNLRYQKPLYSTERYQNEIHLSRMKKEEFAIRKNQEDRDKELFEDEEISQFLITHPESKLDMDEFLKKYEHQVRLWNARKNGDQLQPANEDEKPTFKPIINKKSKELARDLESIQSRIGKFNENKKKKIEDMLKETKPSFTPRINKSSIRMVNENRSRASSTISYKSNSSVVNSKNIEEKKSRTLVASSSASNQRSKSQTIQHQQFTTATNNMDSKLKAFMHKSKVPQANAPKKQLEHNFNKSPTNIYSSVSLPASSKIVKPEQIVSILQSQEWVKGQAQDILMNNKEFNSKRSNHQSIQSSKNNEKSSPQQKGVQNGQNLHNFLKSYIKESPEQQQKNNENDDDKEAEILSQYLRLKDEINESLSNRNSNANLNINQQQEINQNNNLNNQQIKNEKEKLENSNAQKLQKFKKGAKNDNKTSLGYNPYYKPPAVIQQKPDKSKELANKIQSLHSDLAQITEAESILNNIKDTIDIMSARGGNQPDFSNNNNEQNLQMKLQTLKIDANKQFNIAAEIQQSKTSFQEEHDHSLLIYKRNNNRSNNQITQATNLMDSKKMDIETVSQYIDNETKLLLQSSHVKRSNTNEPESEHLNNLSGKTSQKSFPNDSQIKKNQIVKKLIQSNSRMMIKSQNDDHSLINIPIDVMAEIEDNGLDSLQILHDVIDQFPYLFKESPPRFKNVAAKLKEIESKNKKGGQKKKVQNK